MEYNEAEQVYEGTLILSAHDLEMWLEQKQIGLISLEEQTDDELLLEAMGYEVFEHFKVSTKTAELSFTIYGYEVLPNGLCQIYFASNKVDSSNELEIRFDLLMDAFPEQQNKITFLQGKESYTATFTSIQKQANIQIK